MRSGAMRIQRPGGGGFDGKGQGRRPVCESARDPQVRNSRGHATKMKFAGCLDLTHRYAVQPSNLVSFWEERKSTDAHQQPTKTAFNFRSGRIPNFMPIQRRNSCWATLLVDGQALAVTWRPSTRDDSRACYSDSPGGATSNAAPPSRSIAFCTGPDLLASPTNALPGA
jgi:hypothetical protein